MDWPVDFLKSICGLSSSVVDKTLYSKHAVVIGLRYLPVSVPVGVLHAMDKYLNLEHTPISPSLLPISSLCFSAAANSLKAFTRFTHIPVQTVFSQFASFEEFGNNQRVNNSWGFKILSGVISNWAASEMFTHGSFVEEAKRCGSAVLFRNGAFIKFRPVGHQGIIRPKWLRFSWPVNWPLCPLASELTIEGYCLLLKERGRSS